MSSSKFCPHGSGIYVKEAAKNFKSQRLQITPSNSVCQTQWTNPHINAQRLAANQNLHKFNPVRVSALRRRKRHRILPLVKKLSTIDTLWPREFHQEPCSSMASCPGIIGQHKTNSLSFLWKFYFILSYFSSLVLLVVCSFVLVFFLDFFFCFCCREERKRHMIT